MQIRFLDKLEMTRGAARNDKGVARNDKGSRFLDKLEMTREWLEMTKVIPFLKQVAAHYLATDIQDTCFVFPNRRSSVFFRKYLGDLVRDRGGETDAGPHVLHHQ